MVSGLALLAPLVVDYRCTWTMDTAVIESARFCYPVTVMPSCPTVTEIGMAVWLYLAMSITGGDRLWSTEDLGSAEWITYNIWKKI